MRNVLLSFAVLLGWAAVPAAAQPLNSNLPRSKQSAKQLKNKQPQLPKGIPNAQVEILLKMSPEERGRALANFPPERRQQIEQQLERLDQLTPEQRQQLDRRYFTLMELPPLRRQAVREELQYLRRRRPLERRAELTSDEFAQKFSPEEQKLIREVMTGQPQE